MGASTDEYRGDLSLAIGALWSLMQRHDLIWAIRIFGCNQTQEAEACDEQDA